MRMAFGLIFALAISSAALAYAQQAQQPQQGGRGGRGGQAAPEPRIVSFEAKPTSIRAGESVVLVWSTENPSGITIEPEIGAVAARGTKQVRPTVTTIYTLALRNGPSKTVTVTV